MMVTFDNSFLSINNLISLLTFSKVKSSKINFLFLNLKLYSFTFPFNDFNVFFNQYNKL